MSKSPNFTVFSWKVFVSRGPCYKDIMGGFFMRPGFSQIRQTLKKFFGRVAVLRGLCNLYKIEGIFFMTRGIVKTAKLYRFFLGGVSFLRV